MCSIRGSDGVIVVIAVSGGVIVVVDGGGSGYFWVSLAADA